MWLLVLQYGSLQDEAEKKTTKLKKLFDKYQSYKSELKDEKAAFEQVIHDMYALPTPSATFCAKGVPYDCRLRHHQEREDLLATVRELTSQLKRKQVIVCDFISSTYTQR